MVPGGHGALCKIGAIHVPDNSLLLMEQRNQKEILNILCNTITNRWQYYQFNKISVIYYQKQKNISIILYPPSKEIKKENKNTTVFFMKWKWLSSDFPHIKGIVAKGIFWTHLNMKTITENISHVKHKHLHWCSFDKGSFARDIVSFFLTVLFTIDEKPWMKVELKRHVPPTFPARKSPASFPIT